MSKDSVSIKTGPDVTEQTSTMRDAFGKDSYQMEDSSFERYKIQQKITKNTIVFGMDKDRYFKPGHSRSSTHDLSQHSKEARQAADGVKKKLLSHNFRFGSHKPDYRLSSDGDKIVTKETLMEAYKLSQDNKPVKKMYSTQSAWNNTRSKLNPSRAAVHHKSRSNIESPTGLNRQFSEDKKFNKLPAQLKAVDINDLKKSSIKLGDSGTFNELSNNHLNKQSLFWNSNRSGFSKTINQAKTNISPFQKKQNLQKTHINLGDSKTQDTQTSSTDQFKQMQVSKDIRNKDQEVHDFMRKRNVYLGSSDIPSNSVTKSSFTTHSKKLFDEANGENPLNSNFKKHIFLNGSPTREVQMETKLSSYGDKISNNDNSAFEMSNKNKQLKRELLSHAFNLGYGKDTHKRGPSMDVIQHMKQHGVPVGECGLLKKKNERQNFKYSQDISSREDKLPNSLNKTQAERRYILGKTDVKLPIDYRKTNFAFTQVDHKTETGSLSNSMLNDYNSTFKNSLKSNNSGFSELSNYIKPSSTEESMQLSSKNKVHANKSNFTVGYNKGDFSTSYNNNYRWKVPKVDI